MLTQAHPAATLREPPTIRVAGRADYPAIRRLLTASYAPYAAQIPPEVFGVYLAELLDLDRHARDGQLLVAELGTAIAGFAAFYPDAALQGLGWPSGWAGGRGLAVDPAYRGHGVAATMLADVETRARDVGSPVFAFHTSNFMTTAVALYERLGYRRVPEFDVDINAHYGIESTRRWTALGYLRCLTRPQLG